MPRYWLLLFNFMCLENYKTISKYLYTMASLTEKDISNLSYRMTTQIDLAMNDLKNVKENILSKML